MKKRPYSSRIRDDAANATRARIVKAARDVLASGRVAFSLETVAKRAKVTRLTIYNQFETKSGLLDAVFDELAGRGGLEQLRDTFAIADPEAALRSLVSIFCGFWHMHHQLMGRLMFALEDPDVAASIRERRQRKRVGLTVIVGRLMPAQTGTQAARDLIDVLVALTSFEFYDLIATGDRSAADVERLIQEQVDAAVARSLRRSGA